MAGETISSGQNGLLGGKEAQWQRDATQDCEGKGGAMLIPTTESDNSNEGTCMADVCHVDHRKSQAYIHKAYTAVPTGMAGCKINLARDWNRKLRLVPSNAVS